MIFNINIGLEFQIQMKDWLKEHPEIHHEWRNTDLVIYHPINIKEEIYFKLNSNSVVITFENIRKEFKRKLFESIDIQVLKIRGYWINHMINPEDLEIRKPQLSNNEIAVFHCNSKYGQVLTVDLNVYTGWGEVYKIFNTINDARAYCKSISNNKDIETHIFNSEYDYIEGEK